MAEQRAVAAGARTGSSAGLAKSPWRGIGRRLSCPSKSYLAAIAAPVPSHPLGDFKGEPAEDGDTDAQKSMTETTALLLLLQSE
jgi:hypothetical protein